MVYKNDYVMAILCGGKTLREVNGEVFLPFGSEYTIRVRNKSDTRVAVSLEIDGSSIFPLGSRLVVEPGDYTDIERMVVNGDLTKGPRLKFVDANGPENTSQDPDDPNNGLIIAKFYPEILDIRKNSFFGTPDHGITTDVSFEWKCGDAYSCSVSNFSCSNLSRRAPVGVTAPGSESNQSFKYTAGLFATNPDTVLELRLRGLVEQDKPVLVKDTRFKYCTSCGRKLRFKDRFCSRCGERQVN